MDKNGDHAGTMALISQDLVTLAMRSLQSTKSPLCQEPKKKKKMETERNATKMLLLQWRCVRSSSSHLSIRSCQADKIRSHRRFEALLRSALFLGFATCATCDRVEGSRGEDPAPVNARTVPGRGGPRGRRPRRHPAEATPARPTPPGRNLCYGRHQEVRPRIGLGHEPRRETGIPGLLKRSPAA